MATKVTTKTTFEPFRSLEPIYTGGELSSNGTGSLIATCVDEEDALIVDVKTARPLTRISGDGEALTSLCFSPTSSHLVLCSRSLSMMIYALTHHETVINAELVRTLKPHTSPVVASTIDATGSLLVTGGADGIVKVWDLRGGYCSHTFHGHGGVVTAVEVFSVDAASVNKGSRTGTKNEKRTEKHYNRSEPTTTSIYLLASAGDDGKIRIWDLNARISVATLDSHTTVVRALRYSADQRLLLSASRDKTLVFWEPKSWSPRRVIPVLEELEVGGFLLDGSFCWAGGENGRLRIWNTMTGQEITEKGDTGTDTELIVKAIAVEQESAFLVVYGDQTMQLQSWKPLLDLTSGSKMESLPVIRRISGNHDEIIDMACVGHGKSLLALADNTENVKIISLKTGSNTESSNSFGSDVALLSGHRDVVICLDVDWSGGWLATGAKDNTARLWRLDSQSSVFECFAIFEGHTASIGAIALPRSTPSGGSPAQSPLTHAPDFLLTGSEDKTVKKWDMSKLPLSTKTKSAQNVTKAVFTRIAHEKDINAIDTSPVAPLFASASQDRTIKVWSTDDGSVTGILRGHKRGVWSIRFSPVNTPPLNLAEGGTSGSRGLLASGSGDGTVKVWSLSTYTCLMTFESHQNSVLKVIWIPPPPEEPNDQRRQHHSKQPMVASASSDTLVKIWSPYASSDSDPLLATLDNHSDRVWSLSTPLSSSSVSKDESVKPPYSLISGAADAKITFWTDTTAETAETTSKAVTERIEQGQLLDNHIHARNYKEIITLSLALDHPGRLLRVFQDLVNLPDAAKESGTFMGVKSVDDVLSNLSQEQTYKLLQRVRDWNTNARTATVAQKVLNCLLRQHPQSFWLDMARNRNMLRLERPTKSRGSSQDAVKDLFRAIQVYTDRHYKRMDELIDESYLVEYTLREMDEITGTVDGLHV